MNPINGIVSIILELYTLKLKEEFRKLGEWYEDSHDEVSGSDLPERCLYDVFSSYGFVDLIDDVKEEVLNQLPNIEIPVKENNNG